MCSWWRCFIHKGNLIRIEEICMPLLLYHHRRCNLMANILFRESIWLRDGCDLGGSGSGSCMNLYEISVDCVWWPLVVAPMIPVTGSPWRACSYQPGNFSRGTEWKAPHEYLILFHPDTRTPINPGLFADKAINGWGF